jgi:multidrug resistance efflux pump
MSDQEKKEKKSPVKKLTVIILIISLLFFVWYILSDRHTPYTDQANIQGLITPVTPRVSGYITRIGVKLHKQIKKGDTLFQLDRKPFEIAIAKAEADLDNTVQSVSASTSSVKSAVGRLGVAKAQMDRAQRNWNRVQKVLKENAGALSEADVDQSETALLQATEQVASAEANLDREKQRLGDSGPDNPKIRAALKNLEKAQLDLAFSTILAPTDGVIESFNIDLGYYASAGQPLTTLISTSDIWIQANMKENNLSLMKTGDKVEFAFDIAPGKIYKGTVRSMGYGIATEQTNKGGLPSIKTKTGWLQDPQRFPVIINIEKAKELKDKLRLGGQVDVVVYNGNSFILNSLAALKIRFIALLSYVR